MMKRIIRQCLCTVLAVLCCACAGRKERSAALSMERVSPRPPAQVLPALRIVDYRGRNEGTALDPWLRAYLAGGLAEAESLPGYEDSYLFVSIVRSTSREAVLGRLRNFTPEQDFSRLAAERIRLRLDGNVLGDPREWYGFHYERTIKAAYGTHFWGSRRRDDAWVRASSPAGENAEPGQRPEDAGPLYWGFVLASIPRDTLEIQVNELLQNARNPKNRETSRDQNAAFNNVKEHFFERF